MAFAFHNYALAIMLLAMIPFEGTHCSNQQHLKSLQVSVFQHEAINETGFVIARGIDNGSETAQNPFVYVDPLTVTADRSSKVVGMIEGTTLTSSFDGLQSLFSIAKVTLNLKGYNYKGSVSILGTVHNTKISRQPIVGGTGDFLFVQGYVTSTPVDLTGPSTFICRADFYLCWPPYAS